MPDTKQALSFLETEIGKTQKRTVLNFDEYLELAQEEPQRVLRNIFQSFYDMVKMYVGEGVDEYPDDPESIGFVKYDCSKLFTEGADTPFLADRLFANRFVRQVESLKQGFQQNRIYAYDGPSGCGKSTFLNNLLRTFEAYTTTKDGQIFEVFWEIDERLFVENKENPEKFTVTCPSHDYPILMIPKQYRSDFLNRLLPDGTEIKSRIFKDKDYQWIFRGEVCTICKSIFWSSLERLGSIDRVLGMLRVRTCKFDRRLGEGISIFNPGDRPTWGISDGRPVGGSLTNRHTQEKLDQTFGPNVVKYVFSPLARTNNGIYVLMDIKSHNEERFLDLHNVISEGVHRVGDIEEHVASLFYALMNPEDKKILEERNMESLQGRIQYNKIPFVLEPSTEVNIYRNIFGNPIAGKFLPRVLENFARVIIASRMNKDCKPLKEWIRDLKRYKKYCDDDGLLLRMEIYMGIIPDWLSEEHRKGFTAIVRRALVAEGEHEGVRGFSGRESIRLFSEFFNRYSGGSSLISMENVDQFFKHRIGREQRDEFIPPNFLSSLIDSYDYAVLSEVKEAIYFYNKEQISTDILHYLWAVNYGLGTKTTCRWTGEEFEVTLSFLKLMVARISGKEMTDTDTLKYAQETQKKYTITASRGPVDTAAHIIQTELYQDIFNAYARNLKEKALAPFAKNPNFSEAIKAFGTEGFETFDTRLREHVAYMIRSLIDKFGYTEQGAKQICLYVIEKNLADKFS